MNVETIVNDVKGRVEPIVAKGQDLVFTGFETLKSVNSIVLDGVSSLVQTHVQAGKDLFAVAQTSFEKARVDGFKAVAADPIAYLPEGKDRVISAYNDTVTVVSKTSDKVLKTVKTGYTSISAKLGGAPVRKAKPAARKTTRKTATKAKKAA